MRAFVGVALPRETRAALERLQHRFMEARADVKWVTADCLHVTLKFLDEISDTQRNTFEAALTRVAAAEQACSLALGPLGAFPTMHAPRVVWVGLAQGAETVGRLAEAIEREARALRLRREERPHAPHVTLGRVRSSRHLPALVQQLREVTWQPPPPWRVEAVTLYQSVLTPTGPQYSTLADVPLGLVAPS